MPSHINNFAELVQVLNLQKNNLPTYQVQVNGTGVDITEITNELNNLTAIASFADLADAYKRTIIGMKQQLYDGDVSEPVQAFPPNLTTPTLVLPLSGALTRARERNRRFKATAGYTDAMGGGVGMGRGRPPVILPGSLPTIDVSAAE